MKAQMTGSCTFAKGTASTKISAEATETASAIRRSIGRAGMRDRKVSRSPEPRCGMQAFAELGCGHGAAAHDLLRPRELCLAARGPSTHNARDTFRGRCYKS